MPSTVEDLIERVERLLVRHDELRRTNDLLTQQLGAVSTERDNLRSRLAAARARIDALIEKLPEGNPEGDTGAAGGINAANGEGALMKQMEVSILGQSYVLACPEGGETNLLEAVALVDGEMSAIRDSGKVRSRERIAVLAALNLAYQLAERPAATALRAAGEVAPRPAPGGDADVARADIDALVQRIDAAIGHDGQLL